MTEPKSPSYTSASESPAYPTQPSTAFRIGKCELGAPLVELRDIKLHLALLRAFTELRAEVENQTGAAEVHFPQGVKQLSPERRWTWFVHLAVERFERWTRTLPSGTSKSENASPWGVNDAPPLDVWLVWHAYLLNPRCYAEDTQRVPSLARLGRVHVHSSHAFFSALEQQGDPCQLTSGASLERREDWVRSTGLPFDPIECAAALVTQKLECPNCGQINEAPYITADGTGSAQQGFAVTCTQDGFSITREALAVARFSKDLASNHSRAEVQKDPTPFLANSLRTSTKQVDFARAKFIKDVLLNITPSVQHKLKMSPGNTRAIGRELEWKWSKLQANKKQKRLVMRVLAGYNDQRPYSVELVGAVLRQGSFVSKMTELGWTESGYFDERVDERALHHATARYHAFLDLMASSPDGFFVPTLDIDLVWHTHQLSASTYNSNCLMLVGRFIDHDDKVEDGHLSDGFDETCRAWNARFGIQYMHCGCPLPGKTIGQRLARLIQHTSHVPSDSALHPTDSVAATHPSDHNGVHVPGVTTGEHTKTIGERRERDLKSVQKGKIDARGAEHAAAFLHPVPIWFGTADCAVGGGDVEAGGYAGCSVESGAACTGGGYARCGGGTVTSGNRGSPNKGGKVGGPVGNGSGTRVAPRAPPRSARPGNGAKGHNMTGGRRFGAAGCGGFAMLFSGGAGCSGGGGSGGCGGGGGGGNAGCGGGGC